MRLETVDAVRQKLAFEVVLHSAAQMRLNAACGAVLRRASYDVNLRSDILQEATLLLVERLTPARLAYFDEGADRFGGWFYVMCRRCCLDAWRRHNPPWVCATQFVDSERLLEIVDIPGPEPLWGRLMQMIGALQNPLVRSAVLDCVAGLSVGESAARLDVCPRTVNRLRCQGRELLRAKAAQELADQC
ncbi:MAG TPA: hypothetical protein VGM05_28240 [Planctomycetaceae bacterium]|jgi:DNA-directed RNA polymerase specialized sigma24 family protein